MAFLEGKTPKERRNAILAVTLGSVALLGIFYNFVLSGSKPKRAGGTRATARATPTPAANSPDIDAIRSARPPTPIIYERISLGDPVPGRNIFAYYTAPIRTPGGTIAGNSPATAPTEPPTPTPVPPSLILAGFAPSSVYARTGDFALEVAGDKFTPATRVYFNGNEVPTTFESPQRLRAQVPSSVISSEGGRAVIVRTPDNTLFSNVVNFNVLAPPAPQFTYVGLIAKQGNNRDTAVLKRGKDELLSVRRNDTVGGRFRVTNISEQAIELTDTELRIKHTLPFLDNRNGAGNATGRLSQPQRPISPPPVNDDEPLDGDTDNF